MKSVFLIVGLVLTSHISSWAEPLDRREVPAGVQWFAHIDFDAARAAHVAQKVYNDWLSHGPAQEGLRDVRKTIGLDILEDVRSLSFFGFGFEPKQAVVLVRAKVDRQRLLDLLAKESSHREERFGKYTLHTWKQTVEFRHQDTLTGCFARENLVVLARKKSSVETALKVLDGDEPNLAKSSSPLAAKVAEGTIFEAGAIGLDDLANEQLPFVSPILRQSKNLWLIVGEHQEDLFFQVRLVTRSSEVAQAIVDMIKGLRASAQLENNFDPYVVKITQAIQVLSNDRTITVDWRMQGTEVMKVIEREWSKHR